MRLQRDVPMSRRQFRSEDVIRDGKPPECPTCPKYKTCRKPCEAVERWISQDHVGRSNNIVQDGYRDRDSNGVSRHYHIDYNEFIDHMAFHHGVAEEPDKAYIQNAWEVLENLNVSQRSMEFAELYYRQGKSLTETAKALRMSAQAADSRRKILKKEIRDRLERMVLWDAMKDQFEPYWLDYNDIIICFYYKGLMTVTEIAEAIGVSYSTVYMRIKEFKSKLP